MKRTLSGLKCLDKQGSGQLSDLIAGVDWCIENRDTYNIRILSLSVGSPASGRVKDDPLARAVRQAWTSGLVVVAAAGNSGPDGGTITSPGVVPEIITVGASDDHDTIRSDDDEVASFSSRGPTPEGVPKPDVVAPGTHVVSLRANGSYLDKTNIESVVNDDYVESLRNVYGDTYCGWNCRSAHTKRRRPHTGRRQNSINGDSDIPRG